jgi:aminopeptidase N
MLRGEAVIDAVAEEDLSRVVPMRTLTPSDVDDGFEAAFGRQPEMMSAFIGWFGPYPFDGYTAVVTADDLEIPLESQTLSTFGRNFCREDWHAVRLVAHEMAHQWFGNALTLRRWQDIWLHEGFACYAEWLWSEASGAETADHWRGTTTSGWPISTRTWCWATPARS